MTALFPAQVEFLQALLARRSEIVECIDHLLNCQKKPLDYQQDFALLTRQFNECFHAFTGITREQQTLRLQLEHAHWASGFKPRAQHGNDLVDPVEQMLRAFHMWRQTRWPGHKGRLHFAHTLFNLYVVRSLALLCLRLWDDATNAAGARLSQLQQLLNLLWSSSPPGQPGLVRDIRWLFPVAMSPTTDSLAGYFAVAARIAESLSAADRVEIQAAWVQTGAGHLRSQLRDLSVRRGIALDARDLVLLTRMSNALDVALLMEGLVTLLEAYAQCLQSGDERRRRELACAICQGLSPDPELFVNRLDLLGPYTMIEQLFVTVDAEGHAVYTPMGQRHMTSLRQYKELILRLALPLYADCREQNAAGGAYSPYGVLYGFASNLLELIAFKSLLREATPQFSMEDAFRGGDAGKCAWVNGWRNLPHVKPELVEQYAYPQQFVETMGARIEHALQLRASAPDATAAVGRLFIVPAEDADTVHRAALPTLYIVTSDPQLVAAGKATAKDHGDLLHCRDEGEFLVSYATAGGWVAITKDMLSAVLGAGQDATVVGLPTIAAEVLTLMCPELVQTQ
ncbi:MAG: hypothetical protein RLZZ227_40 [Pseudomonadota bacterium]|jgi:hypothetical protein